MKPSHIVIALAGLLLVACTVHRSLEEKQERWKLVFDSRTLVTSRAAFENALDGIHHRWEHGITFREKKNGHITTSSPRPDYPPSESEPSVSNPEQFPKNSQTWNPNSLHVTQRVVLYQKSDYDDVLETIKHPKDDSK